MEIHDMRSDESIGISLARLASSADENWAPYYRRLYELVSQLSIAPPAARLSGVVHDSKPPQIWLIGSNQSMIQIWPDYNDTDLYSQEMPRLHFRMEFRRDVDKLPHEVRTNDPDEIAREIRTVFGLHDG